MLFVELRGKDWALPSTNRLRPTFGCVRRIDCSKSIARKQLSVNPVINRFPDVSHIATHKSRLKASRVVAAGACKLRSALC